MDPLGSMGDRLKAARLRWRPPDAVGRLVRSAIPGMRAVREQVAAYAQAWEEANRQALDGNGPLWVVLGDSTAQGVGADRHDTGYVGQLKTIIEAGSGRDWRVLNLSRSGAKTAEVLDVQLGRLRDLGVTPDLITCAVGANDVVFRTQLVVLEEHMTRLISALGDLEHPTDRSAGSLAGGPDRIIATLPQGLRPAAVDAINHLIRTRAPAAGLAVADVWARTGPPWSGKFSSDWFHPAAAGYADWAGAFAQSLGLDPSG